MAKENNAIIDCDDAPASVERGRRALEQELRDAYCHKCELPELKITMKNFHRNFSALE